VSCGCGERCDAKHYRGSAQPRGLKEIDAVPFGLPGLSDVAS
jgi:hypothetical protein